jgi:hypothetical protein
MGTTKLGPTGQFPQGKLNEHDEGGLQIAIGQENGKVVVKFGKEVAWIGLDADAALAVASILVGHAMAIKEREAARRDPRQTNLLGGGQ